MHGINYTVMGLPEEYVPPDVGAGANRTTYTYNLDRQITQIIRPDGATIGFTYDSGGRLSSLTTPQGTVSYTYEPGTGRLSTITAPEGVALNFTYDGTLPTGTTWQGSVAGSFNRTYNNDFWISSGTINGGSSIGFGYDADGLLTQAGDLNLTRSGSNGLITSSTLGNVTDDRTYNVFGELIDYQAAYNGTGILSISYTRDKLRRITQKAETVGGVTNIYGYTYDLAGRLTGVTKNGNTNSSYAYDSNSNRISENLGTPITATYDNQDRLLQYGATTYTYTANGELQSKTLGSQTSTYQYDALGNLRRVTLPNGTVIDYVIDGLNRRVGKKVNGVLTQGLLYKDRLRPVAELDGLGNLVSQFIYGSKRTVPDYMIKSGNTYRIISDQLGSPRLVIDVASGAIAQEIEYDEFGNVLSDTQPGFQPFGFAGGLYDQQTGLIRFGARDYDSQVGRWTARDPILFGGGTTNLYGYCLNDPVNWKDPSGLFAQVTVSGSQVTIILPIQYTGPGATQGVINEFNQAIEDSWSGTYGSYDVTTVVTEGPENTIYIPERGSGGRVPASEFCAVYPWAFIGPDEPGWTAAHEAGHLMGLEDQYTKAPGGGSDPNKGYEGNIMAENDGVPFERDIDNIIIHNDVSYY